MIKKRHQYSAECKFKVALEAAKGTKTISEIASETGAGDDRARSSSDQHPAAMCVT